MSGDSGCAQCKPYAPLRGQCWVVGWDRGPLQVAPGTARCPRAPQWCQCLSSRLEQSGRRTIRQLWDALAGSPGALRGPCRRCGEGPHLGSPEVYSDTPPPQRQGPCCWHRLPHALVQTGCGLRHKPPSASFMWALQNKHSEPHLGHTKAGALLASDLQDCSVPARSGQRLGARLGHGDTEPWRQGGQSRLQTQRPATPLL